MFDAKPVSSVGVAAEPVPEAPIPPSAEIHTIAEGHLLDHERTSTCWCGPTQDEVEPRIWHHHGCNAEHYKSVIDDAGNDVTPVMACAACDGIMPKGRKGMCLRCLTEVRRTATTPEQHAMVDLLEKAAR